MSVQTDKIRIAIRTPSVFLHILSFTQQTGREALPCRSVYMIIARTFSGYMQCVLRASPEIWAR